MSFTFRQFPPPDPLASLMRGTFYARGTIPYRFDKILPNGLAVAIFNLGEPHRLGKSDRPDDNPLYAHSWLHGVQTSPLYNLPGGETHVLGFLFEPIGFHALFSTDMRSLADRTLDARDVLPPSLISDIEERMQPAAEAECHRRLHALLCQRVITAPPDWLYRLYTDIQTARGDLRLTDCYKNAGKSARHAATLFKTAVGVAPKVLARIYRLGALLEEIDPDSEVSWTDLAHRFGFYDQAHFNREFRAFSGLHPSRYLEERRRDLPELGKGESVHFAPQR